MANDRNPSSASSDGAAEQGRRGAGAFACLAAALALGACVEREDGGFDNEADEAAQAALTVPDEPGLRTAPAVAPRPDAAGVAPPVRDETAPAGQWFLQPGPVAAWGVPHSETVLSLACDGARGEVVVERDAVGVAADVGVITLDADGLRRGLPAVRSVTALGPRLVARIPARDPLVGRLRTATRLRVQAGGETLATTAPGPALGRVLDACREAIVPAAQPAG
ncbi:hypothetical protein [Cognatilysobacter bugurensis]|uniref:Uncharacterized protein n=1 Tax=Cognatilysobacter bugurensis TaxID=543356 RepID=A0A918T203_9GAMM|nr:hypothetical protein [Lysobacter bugurensis]GHA83523.1 hypothetical protein GCM10007067_22050 [Lysobacter bugurensis]